MKNEEICLNRERTWTRNSSASLSLVRLPSTRTTVSPPPANLHDVLPVELRQLPGVVGDDLVAVPECVRAAVEQLPERAADERAAAGRRRVDGAEHRAQEPAAAVEPQSQTSG
jgi:hypothetical protein